MSSFKVNIKEIEDFKKLLQENSAMKSIVPDMTLAVLQLHNTLESRVHTLFNAPGSLSSVLIGKNVKPESLGNTFLRYNLQYRMKAIPLSAYPFTVTSSSAISSAPLRSDPLGTVKWTKGQWSKDIKVSVRKGKPSRARQPGGNFDKRRGFLQGKQIKARLTEKTWSTYPSKGVAGTRAPYSTLFGPGLAELANKVYDQGIKGRDTAVVTSIERLQTELIDSFVRYYSG